MTIRRFIKDLDDHLWASFLKMDLEEFRRSMLNPEFNADGMVIAEANGQIVGIVNAHISPSYPKFCVLRTFKVLKKYWNPVAYSLLKAALGSFSERDAKLVKACFPETEKSYIDLLEANGFKRDYIGCRMKHDLEAIQSLEDANICIKKYSEVKNPGLVIRLQDKIFKGLIGRPVTEEEFLFWMRNLSFQCFIAFFEEKPVGSVFCELEDEKQGKEKHGWIYGLGVLPTHRRLKIGTILLNRVLQFFKNARVDHVLVETDYKSYQQSFYESAGFYVVGKVIRLRKFIRSESEC